jgi:hypothetical protein
MSWDVSVDSSNGDLINALREGCDHALQLAPGNCPGYRADNPQVSFQFA